MTILFRSQNYRPSHQKPTFCTKSFRKFRLLCVRHRKITIPLASWSWHLRTEHFKGVTAKFSVLYSQETFPCTIGIIVYYEKGLLNLKIRKIKKCILGTITIMSIDDQYMFPCLLAVLWKCPPTAKRCPFTSIYVSR